MRHGALALCFSFSTGVNKQNYLSFLYKFSKNMSNKTKIGV